MNVPYSLPSYVFGPSWFHGFDSIIELIAVIISFLLLFYSYRCYKLSSENRYLYFSTAFLSLTLAFISKILGSLAIYLPKVKNSFAADIVVAAVKRISVSQINAITFTFYIFFTILGIMILFLIVSKLTWQNKRVIALLTYFVFVAAWLGIIHYQLFYLTTTAMLALVTYSYYKHSKEIKSKKALMIAVAFGFLLVSHGLFIFSIYSKIIYVMAQVLQLAGFLFLLIPFVIIMSKKPKASKNGV